VEKFTWHQSKLNLMLDCGEAFRRRELNKEREPSGYYAVRGCGTHKGRQVNLLYKKEKGYNRELSDITDAARDEVVGYFLNDNINLCDFEGLPKAAVRDQLIDETIQLVKADFKFYQQRIKPMAVELSVEVELPDWPFNLKGRIDVIEKDYTLRDLKQTKRTPPAFAAACSDQLSLYHIFHKAKYGVAPKKMTLDWLVFQKSGIKPIEQRTMRTEADLRVTMQKFAMAQRAMEAGVFLPPPVGFWKCSPKWCEFYPTCKYVNGLMKND